MVAVACHQAMHFTSCSCRAANEDARDFLIASSSGSLKMKRVFRKERCSLRQSVNCPGYSSNSSLCAIKPIFSSLSSTSDSRRTVPESYLILIRHGESMWNEKNLFTGCVDVPLTSKGVEEAIEAGKRIRHLPIDVVYISALIRSQMTAMLALTEHHCKKVPIIEHNETEQAKVWSQIYSKGTEMQSVPVIKAWQLNERMYFNNSHFVLFHCDVIPDSEGCYFAGTGNFKGLISWKQQKDVGKSKSINGAEAMMLGHPTVRAWKCACEELLPILKSKSNPNFPVERM